MVHWRVNGDVWMSVSDAKSRESVVVEHGFEIALNFHEATGFVEFSENQLTAVFAPSDQIRLFFHLFSESSYHSNII